MKPTTIALLQKCKQEKKRFATITAYDYSFAKLFAEEGINVMLVGDSLGMTVQGHDSTLPVTVEDIAYHTRAVRRGAPACLLLSDLPFMAYATPEQAFENAAAVMRAGANMVKIEGGAWLVDTVKMLTERAVPVCGHLGLTPQSVNIFGGYKVQGRGDARRERIELHTGVGDGQVYRGMLQEPAVAAAEVQHHRTLGQRGRHFAQVIPESLPFLIDFRSDESCRILVECESPEFG